MGVLKLQSEFVSIGLERMGFELGGIDMSKRIGLEWLEPHALQKKKTSGGPESAPKISTPPIPAAQ
jgi:hypothetical protein